jgi:hypothetical protein
MFQFTGLPLPALFYSGGNTRALPRVGFPIRKSRDQRLVSTSPGLIAAAHVLHRLLAPRHPPCALILLIRKNTCIAAMEFSRCTRARRPHSERTAQKAVFQNSTAWLRRGRRISRRDRSPDDPAREPEHRRAGRPPGSRALVSLERR